MDVYGKMETGKDRVRALFKRRFVFSAMLINQRDDCIIRSRDTSRFVDVLMQLIIVCVV